MILSRTSNVEAAELLIAHGAQVNAREKWRDQTALMWAAAEQHPAMVRLLLEHGAAVNERSLVNNWARQVTSERACRRVLRAGSHPCYMPPGPAAWSARSS